MDWNEAKKEERAMLQSVVARFLLLAGLAERLCALPWPLRRFILWLMRPAEASARDFVFGDAEEGDAEYVPDLLLMPPCGDSICEAMRLAGCFRALAAILRAEIDEIDHGTTPLPRPARRFGPLLDRLAAIMPAQGRMAYRADRALSASLAAAQTLRPIFTSSCGLPGPAHRGLPYHDTS